MDPFTMMLAALSTGGKMASSLFQGFAGSRVAEIQGRIAGLNTEILQKNAEIERGKGQLALSRGEFTAGRLADTVRKTISAQTAGFAASNADPFFGSPMLLAGLTAAQGATDMELVRAQAELDNADAIARAASMAGRAATSKWQEVAAVEKATSDRIAGFFGAATALLQGVSSWNSMGGGGGGEGGGFTPSTPGWGQPLRINQYAS